MIKHKSVLYPKRKIQYSKDWYNYQIEHTWQGVNIAYKMRDTHELLDCLTRMVDLIEMRDIKYGKS